MARPDIAIAVLAAGASHRLGRSKQAIRLGGCSLLEHAVRQASRTGQPVYVVIGEGQQTEVGKGEQDWPPVHWVTKADRTAGIGASILAALQAIRQRRPDTGALLVMLVDQPAVSTELLERIIAQYRQSGGIVACGYAGTVGVPALFPARLFEELARIDPRRGAKSLLLRHATEVARIPFEDGARDLDTAEDLAYWRARSLAKRHDE